METYFQKEHNWVFNGCKFNDRLKYATTQTKPNRGFMTSDYHRRCAATACNHASCGRGPKRCTTWAAAPQGLHMVGHVQSATASLPLQVLESCENTGVTPLTLPLG